MSCEIIAEVGVNHNGSLELACELVKQAAACGADVVKFQTYQTEKLVCFDAPKAGYQLRSSSGAESQFQMLKRLELTRREFHALKKCCEEADVEFLSTPFDVESARFLKDELKVGRFKIGSGDVTCGPLLLEVALSGKPVILSTGMSNFQEIESALGMIAFGYLGGKGRPCQASFREAWESEAGRAALERNVTLLHCTSQYPAPLLDTNLLAMKALEARFGLRLGFSDHTEGLAAAAAAAALGAVMIEKHFTLDKTMNGPDHKASLEPEEFKDMVRLVREVETVLGSSVKVIVDSERPTREVARRSLVAATAIKRGDVFSIENLIAKRPGTGISAAEYWDWIGTVAQKDYRPDEMIVR